MPVPTLGIAGLGAMGRNHLRVCSQTPEWCVAAAYDPRQEIMREVLAAYPGVRPCGSLEELLDHCDVLAIATPTEAHATLALRALEGGKPVMVEKPLASTLQEGESMIQAALGRNLPLGVGHLERFNPAFMELQRYLDRPGFVDVQRLGPFPNRSLDVDVVLDLMIHDIDLLLSMDSSPVTLLDAVGVPVLTPRTDIANVRLRFESGLVASLTASRISQERNRKMRVFQPGHYFSLDLAQRSIRHIEMQGVNLIPHPEQVFPDEPLRLMWQAFARQVGGEPTGVVMGRDALKALRLAEDIVRACNA